MYILKNHVFQSIVQLTYDHVKYVHVYLRNYADFSSTSRRNRYVECGRAGISANENILTAFI